MKAMRRGIDYITEYHPDAKHVKGELKDGAFNAILFDDIGEVHIKVEYIEGACYIDVKEPNFDQT